MIGYFAKFGGKDASQLFNEYLNGENGFNTILKNVVGNKDYSSDLKLLLIKYYVDGEVMQFAPTKRLVSNYSAKNKDISVDVFVKSSDFHDVAETDRRVFIVKSTIDSVEKVQKKLEKKKLEIDFEGLVLDIKKASANYIPG